MFVKEDISLKKIPVRLMFALRVKMVPMKNTKIKEASLMFLNLKKGGQNAY